MGQSAKKRVEYTSKPKSKKTQNKFAKRMTKNYEVLKKLQ